MERRVFCIQWDKKKGEGGAGRKCGLDVVSKEL